MDPGLKRVREEELQGRGRRTSVEARRGQGVEGKERGRKENRREDEEENKNGDANENENENAIKNNNNQTTNRRNNRGRCGNKNNTQKVAKPHPPQKTQCRD